MGSSPQAGHRLSRFQPQTGGSMTLVEIYEALLEEAARRRVNIRYSR
jgi:hypothetical protein